MSEVAERARRAPPEEVDAIVVGRLDAGEVDRVIRLLTPDRGLLAGYAHGARRPRSPFAGLDVGARATVRFHPARGELVTLAGATVAEARVRLRGSYERLVVAAYACELVGALASPAHPEPRQFGLLETALLLLDHADEPPGAAFVAGLEGKALTFAGLAPRLTACAACGRAPDDDMAWLPHAGGLYHPACLPAEPGPWEPMTATFAAALDDARRAPLRDGYATALPAGPLDALARAAEAHLGRALKSRAALAGAIG